MNIEKNKWQNYIRWKMINQNKNEDPAVNKTETEEKKEEPKFPREELNYENLYSIYNFDKNKFFKEKEIIELLANKQTNKQMNNEKGKEFKPKIRYQNNNLKIETEFLNQLTMINNLVQVYNKYIIDLDEEKIDYKLVLDCCMNVIVYMRNISIFKGLEEITDVVEVIFYLILNKYGKNN